MTYCYPAIILFSIAIFLFITGVNGVITSGLSIMFPIVISSAPLFFGLLSMFLCNKGYKVLAWLTPLIVILILGYIGSHI